MLYGSPDGRDGNAMLYCLRTLVVPNCTRERETGRGVEETKTLFLIRLLKPIEAAEQSQTML
jgi:hypothetical protein